MALTTNEWNTVTFQLLSHASWATVPTEGLPAAVLQAVRDGTSLDIFVLDDSGPITFTYLAGPLQVIVPTACFATDTPVTTNVQTIDSTSEIWYSMRGGAGEWLWYSSQLGQVREVAMPGALSAFLA